jgi:hypothetical protein
MQRCPQPERVVPRAQRRDRDDRLRLGVEASATGIWELDLSSGRVTANARHLALLGLPPGCPLTFRAAIQTLHVQDRRHVVRAIADTIRTEGDSRSVVEYRTAGPLLLGDMLVGVMALYSHQAIEPLLRGTAEVDRTGRSIGLGLHIVKPIADAHGGRVEVRSAEEEGTTFTLLLPH